MGLQSGSIPGQLSGGTKINIASRILGRLLEIDRRWSRLAGNNGEQSVPRSRDKVSSKIEQLLGILIIGHLASNRSRIQTKTIPVLTILSSIAVVITITEVPLVLAWPD